MSNDSGVIQDHIRGIVVAKFLVRLLWSIVFVVGTVVLASVLGLEFVDLTVSQLADSGGSSAKIFGASPGQVAVTGLSVGLLLTSLKSMWGALVPLYRYVINRDGYDFPSHFMALFAPAFFLAFALYSIGDSEGGVSDVGSTSDWTVHFVSPMRPSAEQHAVFPLYFEAGQLNNLNLQAGFQTTSYHREKIKSLVDALSPCGTESYKVELEIVGFASSKSFGGLSKPAQAQLNLELNRDLANLRAASVAAAFDTALSDLDVQERFSINRVEHRTHQAMLQSRIHDDRPYGSTESNESEYLTRSAHIRLNNAAQCKYGNGLVQINSR